jgi:hypothetical protein
LDQTVCLINRFVNSLNTPSIISVYQQRSILTFLVCVFMDVLPAGVILNLEMQNNYLFFANQCQWKYASVFPQPPHPTILSPEPSLVLAVKKFDKKTFGGLAPVASNSEIYKLNHYFLRKYILLCCIRKLFTHTSHLPIPYESHVAK